MSKTIALFDLDTPIYKAAAACEQRTIEVTHTPTGATRVFKNRTEFKELLKSKDKLQLIEQYKIEDQQEAEPLSHAIKLLKSQVEGTLDCIWPDHTVYMLSGPKNFRNDLPLPSPYKGTRSPIRPLLLKELRQYAKKQFNALQSDMEECDDTQVWMGYEELAKGNKPVLIASDKDAKAYSGLFLFNPDKPQEGLNEIPALGEIFIDDKNKVRANGMMQYGLQMTIGDRIDSYAPTEICGVKFGEKSAYKLLKDCKTEQEILGVVQKQYKLWYSSEFTYTDCHGSIRESNWLGMMQLYHSCVRMKETKNDKLNVSEFFSKYGVELTS